MSDIFRYQGHDLSQDAGRAVFFSLYDGVRAALHTTRLSLARAESGLPLFKATRAELIRWSTAMRDVAAEEYPRQSPEGAHALADAASRMPSLYIRDLAGYMAMREVASPRNAYPDKDFYVRLAVTALTDPMIISLPQSETVNAMYEATASDFTTADPDHVPQILSAWAQGAVEANLPGNS